jgi:hypothetical protein
MITRINARVEKALRSAMAHVAHAEPDQIEPSVAVLDEAERTEALGLAVMIAGYVIVDACGAQWPDDANVRQFAEDLATTGTTARRLHLDAHEIHKYLSQSVLGGPLARVPPRPGLSHGADRRGSGLDRDNVVRRG